MAKYSKAASVDRTDERVLPPLEYLHVVGYFVSSTASLSPMLSGMLLALKTEFGELISLTDRVGAKFTRTDKPNGDKENGVWKHWNGDWYAASHPSDTSILSTLSSPEYIPSQSALNLVVIDQEGKRRGRASGCRLYDFVWALSLEKSDSVTPRSCGNETWTCVFSIATSVFVPAHQSIEPSRSSSRFADEIIRAWLTHGSLSYALIEPSYFREDSAGWCYLNGGPSGSSSVRFRIEDELWKHHQSSRHGMVRGVYHGQYLSALHLEKLGGKEQFIVDLLKLRDRRDDLITDFGDQGVVLRLVPTVIDSSSRGPNQGVAEIGAWVFRRFREAGLLP